VSTHISQESSDYHGFSFENTTLLLKFVFHLAATLDSIVRALQPVRPPRGTDNHNRGGGGGRRGENSVAVGGGGRVAVGGGGSVRLAEVSRWARRGPRLAVGRGGSVAVAGEGAGGGWRRVEGARPHLAGGWRGGKAPRSGVGGKRPGGGCDPHRDHRRASGGGQDRPGSTAGAAPPGIDIGRRSQAVAV